MPAGVSWSRYLTFSVVGLCTMIAGSQTVHMYYRPLDDLKELVDKEYRRRKENT